MLGMENGSKEGLEELALLYNKASHDPPALGPRRSDSFHDVRTVATDDDILGMKRPRSPFVGAMAMVAAATDGAAAIASKKSKLSSVCKLASGLTALQEHENDMAEVVVVCEPEQASLMMGGLHPRGSLYERPINIDVAKAQHAEFRTQVRHVARRVPQPRSLPSAPCPPYATRMRCQWATTVPQTPASCAPLPPPLPPPLFAHRLDHLPPPRPRLLSPSRPRLLPPRPRLPLLAYPPISPRTPPLLSLFI